MHAHRSGILSGKEWKGLRRKEVPPRTPLGDLGKVEKEQEKRGCWRRNRYGPIISKAERRKGASARLSVSEEAVFPWGEKMSGKKPASSLLQQTEAVRLASDARQLGRKKNAGNPRGDGAKLAV